MCDAYVSDVDLQGDKQLPLGGRIAMVTSPITHTHTLIHHVTSTTGVKMCFGGVAGLPHPSAEGAVGFHGYHIFCSTDAKPPWVTMATIFTDV